MATCESQLWELVRSIEPTQTQAANVGLSDEREAPALNPVPNTKGPNFSDSLEPAHSLSTICAQPKQTTTALIGGEGLPGMLGTLRVTDNGVYGDYES